MKNSITKKMPISVLVNIVLIFVAILGIGIYMVHNVSVKNNASPVILIESDGNAFSVSATENDFLNGVVATDKEDGDVTNNIIIESISPISNNKYRTITYACYDSSNNVTKLERNIEYTDYTSPVFTNPTNINVKIGDISEIMEHLGATDVVDGDISSKIKLELNYVNKGVVGKYPIRASVTNSCGDVVTKDCIVNVTGEE